MADEVSRAWRSVDPGQPESPTGRRRQILTMLRESKSPWGVAELAERLGVHQNTVRFHLDALVETGRVESVTAEPAGPGRPPLRFSARQGMDPSGPRNYRLLAEILATGLARDPHAASKATETGRAWGRRLVAATPSSSGITGDQATDRMVGLLDDAGFDPELQSSAGGRHIGLRHCPFLELAQSHAGIICPLHLGLMQGALTALGSSVTVDRLDPFAEPGLCLAHLASAEDPS